jgi:hypothetical protein
MELMSVSNHVLYLFVIDYGNNWGIQYLNGYNTLKIGYVEFKRFKVIIAVENLNYCKKKYPKKRCGKDLALAYFNISNLMSESFHK